MSRTKQHPIEFTAEWGAPVLLAIAAGWAAYAMAHPPAAAAAVGIVAMAIGVAAIRLAGGALVTADAGFEPVPFEGCVADEELLLDDPLTENAPDSRVVQLFAAAEPTPGELVVRIEDYLSDGRRAGAAAAATVEQRPVDASAALYAALANIRASLR